MINDFKKYAKGRNVSGLYLDSYVDSYVNPTILEERKLNVASLDVFSRLLYDRIIFIGDEIDDDLANVVVAQLLYLSSVNSKDPISLYINSPGGSVSAGLSIYDTMQIVAPQVNTICTGMAASMGSILLAGGEKGSRKILPHARVMIHQVSGGTGKSQCSDVQIVAKEMKSVQDDLYNILAERTGKTFEQIDIDADRDHWMTAQEAIDYGIVDSIVTKSE